MASGPTASALSTMGYFTPQKYLPFLRKSEVSISIPETLLRFSLISIILLPMKTEKKKNTGKFMSLSGQGEPVIIIF